MVLCLKFRFFKFLYFLDIGVNNQYKLFNKNIFFLGINQTKVLRTEKGTF